VLTAGVLLVRVLQTGNPDLPADRVGPIIGTSVFLGIIVAAVSGWLRTGAIDDYWRRGVTAGVSVFGAAILAIFATAADLVAGPVGIAVYLLFLIAGAWRTHRAALRAARR
jgi:hypothetical protein